MSLGDIFPYFTGAGGAIFALLLGWALLLGGKIMTGRSHREVCAGKDALVADKDRQITALTLALSRERERADTMILTAHVTREVMEGVRKAVE
jgi:hypothetical protein